MKKTICAVTAAMLALTSVLCGCSSNSESSSQSGSTTSATVATDTTVKTTGEKIHINDSTLGEIWITELDGVPKNTLNNDNFTSDDTFKYYSENGKAASMEGIDISSYSGTIDWDKVKKSGVDFVMVRIGGRGYGSDGKMYSDDSALSYIKGAKAAGLKVGVYFFSQAVNNDEAIEEADYIKSLLGDETIDFPVAYDWEIIKDDDARTDSVSAAQATACAKAFCNREHNAQRAPPHGTKRADAEKERCGGKKQRGDQRALIGAEIPLYPLPLAVCIRFAVSKGAQKDKAIERIVAQNAERRDQQRPKNTVEFCKGRLHSISFFRRASQRRFVSNAMPAALSDA